jgi:NodT family efflux transporter outer membrane factor (OMF) lipoprotein
MKRALLLAALPIAVAGCSVGPAYKHPDTPTPRSWSSAAPPGGTLPSADWWKSFGSQQLNSLIERARQHNYDLAAAAARIQEADAQAREAGAPLLPSLSFGTEVGPSRQLNLTGHERNHVDMAGVFQASYQLDFWGKNKAALQAAEDSRTAAGYAWQVVNLSTMASVATAYFQYIGLTDQLRVAEANLTRAQHTLSGLSDLARSGAVPMLDVVQQQTIVDGLTAQPPLIRQQIEHVHTALAILVGVLPEELQLAPESLSDLKEPVVDAGLPSELLARRPDVQEAEANLMAANANIRVAHAAFFPSFNLTASGGLESYALSHYTVPPLAVYSLLGSMSAPLFEGGLLRAQLHYSEAHYKELLQTYGKTALSAFGDVEDALTAVKETNDRYVAQEKTLRSAQQSYRMALEAFHGGTTNILTVFTAEAAVTTAEGDESEADIAHMHALVDLYQALGGGWTKQDVTAQTQTPAPDVKGKTQSGDS